MVLLFDYRIDVFDLAGQNKNTRVGLKAETGIVAQVGSIDYQAAAEVVAHEKDRPAAFRVMSPEVFYYLNGIREAGQLIDQRQQTGLILG